MGSQRIECSVKLDLPIALSTTLLLGVGWAVAGVSRLAEVAREMLLSSGGAIGETNVVTVSSLVSAGHCIDSSAMWKGESWRVRRVHALAAYACVCCLC